MLFTGRSRGWLQHLFATDRDDHEWLVGLLKKGEITKYQFHWLSKVFKEKAESERHAAQEWWSGVYHSTYTGHFDVSTVPHWISKLGERTHKHWWKKLLDAAQEKHDSEADIITPAVMPTVGPVIQPIGPSVPSIMPVHDGPSIMPVNDIITPAVMPTPGPVIQPMPHNGLISPIAGGGLIAPGPRGLSEESNILII